MDPTSNDPASKGSQQTPSIPNIVSVAVPPGLPSSQEPASITSQHSPPTFVSFAGSPGLPSVPPTPLVFHQGQNPFASPLGSTGPALQSTMAYPAWQLQSIPPNMYGIHSNVGASESMSQPETATRERLATSNNAKSQPANQSRKNKKKKTNSSGDQSRPEGASRSQKKTVSWLTDRNKDGKSSLDLVVEWMITGENYELWRGGTKSKREVAGIVVDFLVTNGVEGRDARGVEQQITKLEGKYRNAADWRAQTGQGIEDEMEAERAQLSDDSTAPNIAELRREAFNKIDVELRQRCNYFFELDPIISGRASAQPLYARDQLNPETAADLEVIFGENGEDRAREVGAPVSVTPPPASPAAEYSEEWPYSPTQQNPSTNQRPMSAQSVMDDSEVSQRQSGNESVSTSSRKRKNPSDEPETNAKNTPSVLSSRATQASSGASSFSTLPLSGHGRKTHKAGTINDLLEAQSARFQSQQECDQNLSSTIARTLESLTNMNVGQPSSTTDSQEQRELEMEKLRLDVQERKQKLEERKLSMKNSSVVHKVQIFKDLLLAGLSKDEAMSMTNELIKDSSSANSSVADI